MKHTSPLLALAVITTMTSGTSAFMTHDGITRPSQTSLHSSVAATVFFPGRGMMTADGASSTSSSSSMASNEESAISNAHAQRPQATPKPKPATHNMELIDQLKHDATVIFSILDSDGSGSISRQEFVDHLQSNSNSESFANELFDRMDLNGDGAISDSEFRSLYLTAPSLRALPGMGQSQNNQQADDQTNTLSPYETIMAAGDKIFASLDKDGNGSIDFSELKAHLTNLGKSFQDKAMMKIFNLLDMDDDLSLGREEFRDAYWRYSAFRKALGESS